MKKYTAVRKLTDNRFLNLYEMDALTNTGAPFNYYFASRNSEEKLPLLTGKLCSNGIVIYPIWKRNPEKIVMLRQYRYPLDAWLYELPAGLIDEGETASEAAVREMKEETGIRPSAVRFIWARGLPTRRALPCSAMPTGKFQADSGKVRRALRFFWWIRRKRQGYLRRRESPFGRPFF